MNRFVCFGYTVLLGIVLGGCQSPQPPQSPQPVQRYGMVIGLRKDKLDDYKNLHANPWQDVLDQIDQSHIRNFSIWLVEHTPDEYLLFGYLEYDGQDFDADMAAMGDDATTLRWWKETDPCQKPIPTAQAGQQWVMMEEVFYHDKAHRGAALMPPPPKFEAGKAK